ncbi:hypothetical protein ACFLZV_05030 [Candidatus Margulisiibacteriota bacterium]
MIKKIVSTKIGKDPVPDEKNEQPTVEIVSVDNKFGKEGKVKLVMRDSMVGNIFRKKYNMELHIKCDNYQRKKTITSNIEFKILTDGEMAKYGKNIKTIQLKKENEKDCWKQFKDLIAKAEKVNRNKMKKIIRQIKNIGILVTRNGVLKTSFIEERIKEDIWTHIKRKKLKVNKLESLIEKLTQKYSVFCGKLHNSEESGLLNRRIKAENIFYQSYISKKKRKVRIIFGDVIHSQDIKTVLKEIKKADLNELNKDYYFYPGFLGSRKEDILEESIVYIDHWAFGITLLEIIHGKKLPELIKIDDFLTLKLDERVKMLKEKLPKIEFDQSIIDDIFKNYLPEEFSSINLTIKSKLLRDLEPRVEEL